MSDWREDEAATDRRIMQQRLGAAERTATENRERRAALGGREDLMTDTDTDHGPGCDGPLNCVCTPDCGPECDDNCVGRMTAECATETFGRDVFVETVDEVVVGNNRGMTSKGGVSCLAVETPGEMRYLPLARLRSVEPVVESDSGPVAYRPFNTAPTDGDESVRLILDAATTLLDRDDPAVKGVEVALGAILSADERPASEILAEAFARPEVEWNTGDSDRPEGCICFELGATGPNQIHTRCPAHAG